MAGIKGGGQGGQLPPPLPRTLGAPQGPRMGPRAWVWRVSLVMLEGLFRCTKRVSDTLQSPELDYASATGLVQDLLEEFAEKTTQDSLQMVWEEAERVCEDMSIPGLCSARDRKVPNKLRDFVVDTTTGLREPVSSQVDYCNLFPLIDRMTNELKKGSPRVFLMFWKEFVCLTQSQEISLKLIRSFLCQETTD